MAIANFTHTCNNEQSARQTSAFIICPRCARDSAPVSGPRATNSDNARLLYAARPLTVSFTCDNDTKLINF